jgi:hypothetical protein
VQVQPFLTIANASDSSSEQFGAAEAAEERDRNRSARNTDNSPTLILWLRTTPGIPTALSEDKEVDSALIATGASNEDSQDADEEGGKGGATPFTKEASLDLLCLSTSVDNQRGNFLPSLLSGSASSLGIFISKETKNKKDLI